MQGLRFSLETVDGDRLGRLFIPFSQTAEWLNFLLSPHYGAQVVSVEQRIHGIEIYFQACEGVYGYLEDRISAESVSSWDVTASDMALAS